ncbi:MAG: DUF1636 domain-containing protein [Rhodobacteraceae bacterium]|nr:DUF1636 domain-containing protein [Paracoccaceae bacterium]
MQRISICRSCQVEGAEARGNRLAEAVAEELARDPELAGRVEVGLVDCMIVCKQPVSVSVRARGKEAYLFADVDPEAQASEIVAFARLYDESADGAITDARPCGDLRFKLLGRIPADPPEPV